MSNIYIDNIQNGETLSEDQMIEAMNTIMGGNVSEAEMAAFLSGLAQRGETVEELTGAAKVMREKASGLKAPFGAVDCCGTGGDKSGTYNISTAVAIVSAACGVTVAKHGNRASTSKSGTADVLEALGVNLDVSIEKQEEALNTLHFAFLMAPKHHTAMKHVVSVRKKLGTRTIFNLLGPLANPAGTRYQLIGVFDKQWVRPMAETLKALGTKSAWVVHGEDGLDEITTTAKTYVATLDDEGNINEMTISPEDFGLEYDNPEDLIGGEAQENAAALRGLLEGEKCAYRNIVLANTAAVLMIRGEVETLQEGVKRAAEEIDSGQAFQLLKDYIALSREDLK
ncbi:MAG: anthranilate phosphoribosyltransferase [Micavibrio sp. TMED27]|nr:anthranilate phosphoribosyltransferase [Micavibrio sp.]OUT90137.1 MAG: anthranilate phosphoribosyltransferase [Micavibrio sp. TMED27]|tara:strand:+ start:204 stop:1223 length:1020 start_codon:yes stop_codon:yes gene_type:complete